MRHLLPDLRYAVRMLLRYPGFSLLAVLILALGIGATTAIFSVVNAVLLRPLPFDDPHRLAIVTETVKRETVERRALSAPDFRDWRDRSTSFDGLAGWSGTSFTLTGGREAERVEGELVSHDYFRVLGVRPAAGRTFRADEDHTPGTHPVVVIGDALWERRFNRAAGIVGQSITLNDKALTVIGVMPRGFKGIDDDTDVWVPMALMGLTMSERMWEARGSRWHDAIGRLRPGVTIERARAELTLIAQQLEREHAGTNRNYGAYVAPLAEELFGDVRPMLWVLLGAVGFVLLISCANLINLLLVRAATRQREIAVRTALGASAGRVLTQLLIETLVLTVVGATAGMIVAQAGIELLTALSPIQLPSFVQVHIDARVLAFTALLTSVTAVALGIAPALQARRVDVHDTLKEGGRSGSGAVRQGLRSALIVAEVAAALVLLIGASLMIKSFEAMRRVDPGFDPDRLVSVRVPLPTRYEDAAAVSFWDQVRERVRAAPGVQSVALATDLPLENNYSATIIGIEGREEDTPGSRVRIYRHSVTPAFFRTLRIRLLRGRDFDSRDAASTPAVAIISETMASRHFPGQDAVGRRFKFGSAAPDRPWVTIVGVVADVRYRALVADPFARPDDPDVYLPVNQAPDTDLAVLIRTDDDVSSVMGAVRAELRRLDPGVPLYNVSLVAEFVDRETAQLRFGAVMMGVFGLAAGLLAAIGIYGVISYSVTQRTHEIGVRMALGADSRSVLRLVVGQGMLLAMAGSAAGIAGAFALTRSLSAVLYEVSTTDAMTFVAMPALVLIVALIASFVPARRAARVSPLVAIRNE